MPVGCECATKATCGAEVNKLSTPCLETLVSTLCNEAYWLDEQMGVNMRGIFQHLGNDCAGLSLACPADVRPSICTVGLNACCQASSECTTKVGCRCSHRAHPKHAEHGSFSPPEFACCYDSPLVGALQQCSVGEADSRCAVCVRCLHMVVARAT